MDEEDLLKELREIREQLDDGEDLEPTKPEDAFDAWMKANSDKADETLQSYQYRVQGFLDWLTENGITDLSQLTTRDIKEFEAHRQANADVGRQSRNNQFGTIRLFLKYAEDMNAVSTDVVRSLNVPSLTKEDRVNTEKLPTERAEQILDDLNKYRYASRDHVLFLLLWRTTARLGTIRSLDLNDVYLTEDDLARVRTDLKEAGYLDEVIETILADIDVPFLWPHHRPEADTPLKNEIGGERAINLADWVGDTLESYINVNRPDVEDEHGRKPLLASRKGTGRLSKSAMRNSTYILTQPCEFGAPCPHDRDPEECVAREHGQGSKCPSSRSPHKLRTGSITWHRDRGWPISELSDKANTSEELIAGVYDQPEQLVRAAHRRDLLTKLEDDTE